MIEAGIEQCGACGRPLTQVSGHGHRKRRYCDEACRQRAHRARQHEGSTRFAEEQAARLAKLEAEVLQQGAQIEQLLAENARLRQRLDVETRYRMDTRQHHFKAWIKKQPFMPGWLAQRIVDDKALPPQASRGHYEALLHSLHYSDEEIETFRDLWKAMLL
jgi:hypothetical protein